MYKILASDGNEYDSISADKIRQWIRENRVESKTPVMPEGAADWVFLSDLPEFKEAFAATQKRQAKAANKGKQRQLLFWCGALAIAGLVIIIVLVVLKR